MSFAKTQTRFDEYDENFAVDRDHRVSWREFLQRQSQLPETNTTWSGMCEALQRSAQGFDATFGSAFAHMMATPKAHRFDPMEAPVGFFIFVDDPADTNPFGHIVSKSQDAATTAELIKVWTNDVGDSGSFDPGNVRVVDLGYFPMNWGDKIRFATDWCGDDQIIPTHETAAAIDRSKLSQKVRVQAAIERGRQVLEYLERAIKDNDNRLHPTLEHELVLERVRQQAQIKRLKKLL